MRFNRCQYGLFPGLLIGNIWFNTLPGMGASPPQITPLKSLGYSRDIILKGVNPQLTFSIPKPAGGIESNNSFLNLQIKPSPFLDKDSSVRVLLNEEPVAALSVETLRKTPTLKIPLSSLPVGEPFIAVTLESYLFTQQAVCEAIQSGNLYLSVDNNSFFQITPKVADQSIHGFFEGTYEQVVLQVPEPLDDTQLESALWLYGFLSGQFGKRQIPVLWQSPNVKVDPNSAQVILELGTSGSDIQRQGSTLTVRAEPKTVKGLAVEFGSVPFSSQGTTVEAINELGIHPRSNNEQRLSFQELGFDESPRRGSGIQRFRIDFDLAELGTHPQELALSLKSLFTPVNHQKGDRLIGQIYLNNTLVTTHELTQTTAFDDTIFLSTQNLRRTNNLDIVFEHTPSQGECQATVSDLTIQVAGNSYIAWSGEQKPEGTFNDLPYNFLGSGRMVIDGQNPNLVRSTAYLLGMINQMSPRPIFPKLVRGETADQLMQLINNPDPSSQWQIIAVAPQQFPTAAPIRLGENFEIINPLNQEVLLSTRPTDAFGLFQYFSYQDRPTLGLSWWGNDPTRITQLTSLLANPQTGLAQRIVGNVVTTTGVPNDVRSWDLSGKSLSINYPESLDWKILVSRYRDLLVLLGVLMGGGVCWYLYRKLGRLPQGRSDVPPAEPLAPASKDNLETAPEVDSAPGENSHSDG
jgi:hypothetical protein